MQAEHYQLLRGKHYISTQVRKAIPLMVAELAEMKAVEMVEVHQMFV